MAELPEPKTAAEFRERAELLAEQANALPRQGFTLMSMALRESACEMLEEADRLETARPEAIFADEVGSLQWLPRTPIPGNSKAALDIMRDAGIRRLQESFDASERYMIAHGHRMPIEHGHSMPSEPDPRLNRRARRAMARKAASR